MVVLWLDGARMNAKVVEHFPDFYGHRHEVVISGSQNMEPRPPVCFPRVARHVIRAMKVRPQCQEWSPLLHLATPLAERLATE